MHELVFKEATEGDEISQLQRLNYRTFVEELRQYETNPSGVLVDRFHADNRYFVAIEAGELLGMISINGNGPFSIEARLPDVGVMERFYDPCEVRLLAIAPGARYGMVLAGLFWQVYAAAVKDGRSHMLISGVSERREMYESLGFRELGPAVRSGEASYIPMALELADATVQEKAKRYAAWWLRRSGREEVKLLPGPVQMGAKVREAFARAPMSHREAEAITIYERVRRRLSSLMTGMQSAVFTGSGTMANDIVAASLRAKFGERRGVVLSNGEFGERIVRQARSAGLNFAVVSSPWGCAWDHEQAAMELHGDAVWVWGVHLETSTGQLNDLHRLSEQCKAAGVALAADCVSSLGAVTMSGLELCLASGVSGKALGSYAGLAFVFASEAALDDMDCDKMPASFNLREMTRQREPLFTLPTPQLLALDEALEMNYADASTAATRYADYRALGTWVRSELSRRGLKTLVEEGSAAPTICTFALPMGSAERCRRAGFHIAYESSYLKQRRWGQIGVMGELDAEMIAPVFDLL